MKLVIWVATRYARCMVRRDYYSWHPWLGARRVMAVGGCFYVITVLLLAQDAVKPASAERIGRLEVQVERLEAETEKAEKLHRADVERLTGRQQGLRDALVEGQATLTASLRTLETAWSVIVALLLLYSARRSWNGSRTWVRDWQKSHHHHNSS